MKIQSSNKQEWYEVNRNNCECKDFILRHKAQNRLSCNCKLWYKCSKCSCKHQRDNLANIMHEALLNE